MMENMTPFRYSALLHRNDLINAFYLHSALLYIVVFKSPDPWLYGSQEYIYTQSVHIPKLHPTRFVPRLKSISPNLEMSSCQQGLNLRKKKKYFSIRKVALKFIFRESFTLLPCFVNRIFKVICWFFFYEKVHFDIAFPPPFFLSLEK